MLLVDEDIRHGTLAGDFLESVLDRGSIVCFCTNIALVRYVYFISFHFMLFFLLMIVKSKSKKRIWNGMVW